MTFIIGTLQSHCISKHKQVKWKKMTQDMCKFDSNFPYLQSGTLFKWLLEFISWQDLSKKWVITVSEEKSTSFNFIP